MRKSDVKTSYHNGTRGLPMLNVKRYYDASDAIKVAADISTDPLWLQWVANEATERDWESAWGAASEWGWEYAEEAARECFDDDRVRVYSAGRSGGWLVVSGLPDPDGWDAIMLGKWASFARRVADIVADHPYRMADYLYLNAYQNSATACAFSALGGRV